MQIIVKLTQVLLRALSALAFRSPYLILLYSLALTVGVSFYSYRSTQAEMESHFEGRVWQVQNAIVFRMQTYVNALVQTRGLFVAHPEASRQDFHGYIHGIDLLEHYPGIQGIGFARRIPSVALARHIDEVRRSGFPDYHVWPDYARDDYFSIVYLEPLDWRNRRALGFDMFTEPKRRQAMEQARDTGLPAATSKLILVQETDKDTQPGFLIYVPLYHPDSPTDTVAERRAALIGFIYSPFRADDLFNAALQQSMERDPFVKLEIYDGALPDPHALLYSVGTSPSIPRALSSLSDVRHISVAGHPWTLRVSTLPGFFPRFPYLITALIAVFGVAFSLLLFRLVLQEEQRRAAAEAAKTQISGILESIKDAFISINPLWRFTYVNREAARLLGKSREALLGENIWQAFPEAIGTMFQRESLKAASERIPIQFEEFYEPLKTWFEVRVFPSNTGLSIYFSNINQRKRSEEAIRAAQERFRTAFANASVGMAIANLEWRYIDANDAFCNITGYDRKEILGREILSVTHWEDREQNRALLEQLVGGKIRNFELTKRFVKKTGEIVWVQNSVSLVRDKEGKPLHLIAISQDITERKRVEESLAAEKERLAVTLYSIGDGVITLDTDGHVVLMNKVAERLTGWRQAEAVGQPVSRVFEVFDEERRSRREDRITRLLETGEEIMGGEPILLMGKDGNEHLIAKSGAPIRDKDNKIVGAVLVFRDVTEQRKMEEELIKARNLESIGMLAGGIAHDFNNILTAILGNIALAKLYYRGRDKVFDILTEAERAFEPARDLTQQLLTFAKGGMPIKKTASIEELVMETVTFALRGSNIRHEFALAAGLWPVEIDPGQMSQVINNLVINAKQAMPEGGTIRIGAENAVIPAGRVPVLDGGRYVRLTISDTGVGIPPKHLDRIFDPYFTTKQQGSGLGLATTYSIVKKHEGHIEVTSQVGIGTTFTIYLPVSSHAAPAPTPRVENALPMGEGRILVLDDEEPVRKVAGSLLRRLGYRVDLASDGEQVLELYKQAMQSSEPYDAVILDLTIPGGMGGRECMQRLRALDPAVRAIVSSGYSTDPVMAEHEKHGFCGVVAKPYQLKELSETLWRVIKPKTPA